MAQKNWCRTVLHQFFGFIEPEILLGRAVRRGSLPLARGRTGRLSAAQLRDGGLGRHLFGRPTKLTLCGGPHFSKILRRAEPALRQEISRPPARKFAWTRQPARARFRSQKRPNWPAFSRPVSQWRPWPPSVRPLFCCGLYRSPRGCRSGPPPRKSACRGRGPPRR